MSEQIKEGKTVVSVDYLRLLETKNASQSETIGAHKETIRNLAHQLETDKKKVTIVEEDRKGDNAKGYDYYGTRVPGTKAITITKVNLEDAAELIANKTNEKTETELKETKSVLKDKERHIENIDESIKDIEAANMRKSENIQARYSEELFQARKEYKDQNSKYKHSIEDLKEELKKVKNEKTDEQLEKTRKQEVAKLKARIETLESEMNRLINLSWFNRVWDRITKRSAKIEAQKQIRTEERAADNVRINSPAQAVGKPDSMSPLANGFNIQSNAYATALGRSW